MWVTRFQGASFSVVFCGRIDCKRLEMVLWATSPLMGCSCTNYQRVEAALPLIGWKLCPIRMCVIKEGVCAVVLGELVLCDVAHGNSQRKKYECFTVG